MLVTGGENVYPTEVEIITFCRENILRYKAPKSVNFIDELPKTGSGKIYKKGLRDQYWEDKGKKGLLIKMTEKGDAEPEDQSENQYQGFWVLPP